MIALDAALRRLTVCQLTGESRGNGGGLARGCGFASGRLAWGQILPVWHEKRTQKLLCMGLFSKKLHGRRRPRHGYKKAAEENEPSEQVVQELLADPDFAVARISQPRSNHQKPGRGIAERLRDPSCRRSSDQASRSLAARLQGGAIRARVCAFLTTPAEHPNTQAWGRRKDVKVFGCSDDCARCGTAKVDRMPTNG